MSKTLEKLRRNGVEHLALLGNLACNPKFWVVLLADVLALFAALYLSYYLRYEHFALDALFAPYLAIFSLILLVKIPVFYIFGLYRGVWRYTGTRDLINILKAITLAGILLLTLLLYINRFEGFSRSVFILDAIFTLLFITGNRLCIRYFYEGRLSAFTHDPAADKKRLLIIGAGDVAEKVIREIRGNGDSPYEPVGLLDDDLALIGHKIHGVPVLGTVTNLEKHVARSKAHEVLITRGDGTPGEMNRFVELCTTTRVPFKIVPCLAEIIDGNGSIGAIRDISYRDLLGREEIVLEQQRIGNYLGGETVLVTGAGGSIGSELCRQLVQFKPGRLIMLDCSEENLYAIETELVQNMKLETEIIAVLGQVQDIHLLRQIFEKHAPAVVFHGAAYKHVPLVERNPWEAVQNNIVATNVLVEASILYGVERFVLISTDKAVRPTNVMGASKRCAELLLGAYGHPNWDKLLDRRWQTLADHERVVGLFSEHNKQRTRFMAVRFGNVLGSSGSVVPLFKRQIESGGPVTVTHPDIRRYFMLVEEAAQLTLQAGAMGEGGEIFILKMGRLVNIEKMARDLIKLAGKKPDSEIAIKYTSLRAGEKLYEELISIGEGIVETTHDKIMVLKGESVVSGQKLRSHIKKLVGHAHHCRAREIKLALQELIPEYVPDLKSRSVYDAVPSLNPEEVEFRLPN